MRGLLTGNSEIVDQHSITTQLQLRKKKEKKNEIITLHLDPGDVEELLQLLLQYLDYG